MQTDNIKEECCESREMTIVERLEYSRDRLIRELGELNEAIEEIKRKNISSSACKAINRHF